MKFLHVSDIHLGCNLYNIADEERIKDYGRAWVDVLNRAIAEKVDFVLIGGDLFHRRNPAPRAINQAIWGLEALKRANIEVVAIEGNHDNLSGNKQYSWLHTLSVLKLLKFLCPQDQRRIEMKEWNEADGEGSFVDIGRARIFGTLWHDNAVENIIAPLIEEIKNNRREGAFHILMLHAEIEGNHFSEKYLPLTKLFELRPFIDYVALGHIHQHFIHDEWAFNPGCLEITNIEEYEHSHGALLVEVDERNRVEHRLVRDYYQRPFYKVRSNVSGKTAEEVLEETLEKVKSKIDLPQKIKPIVKITLDGALGFEKSQISNNSELISQIRQSVQEWTGAFHIKIENNSYPNQFPVAVRMQGGESREELELRVLEDLMAADINYRGSSHQMARLAIEVKNKITRREQDEEGKAKKLGENEVEEIADFIERESEI